jgi:hypothetical protein
VVGNFVTESQGRGQTLGAPTAQIQSLIPKRNPDRKSDSKAGKKFIFNVAILVRQMKGCLQGVKSSLEVMSRKE